jgi:hypothetical protein
MQASASLCGAEMVEYFELQARTVRINPTYNSEEL